MHKPLYTMNRLKEYFPAIDSDHLTPEQSQTLRLVGQWRETANYWRAEATVNHRLLLVSFALNLALSFGGAWAIWKYGM